MRATRRERQPEDPSINLLAPLWTFRLICVGTTGGGKTNMIASLIENHIPWQALQVVGRHLDGAWDILRQRIERHERKTGVQISHWCDSFAGMTPLDELNPANRNLVVFDDWVLAGPKEQSIMAEFFVRGRHKNCSVVYIAQSWHSIPRLIRLNASVATIFKGYNHFDEIALWKDLGSSFKSREAFFEYLREATKPRYSFAVIDSNPREEELRYRIKWDEAYIPEDGE